MSHTIRYFQKGFNYSQDGPGNRLVYHLQGCNMRCPWCANPEGIPMQAPLMQMEEKLPSYICPEGAICEDGCLDREQCSHCASRACQTTHRNRMLVCPTVEETVDDIYDYIMTCVPMFWDGGGITFSGGEVSLQLDSVLELCRKLRAGGVHVAVETNCTHPRTDELARNVDCFLCDYKHYDREILKKVTLADRDRIFGNLQKVLSIPDLPVLIRVPLVRFFNGQEQFIPGFIEDFRELRKIRGSLQVELLSYHEYGRVKWEQCGMNYPVEDGFVSGGLVAKFTEALKAAGIEAVKT